MCRASINFCRSPGCFGVIGWWVVHPCLKAALAGCREREAVFDQETWDWSNLSRGCQLPKTESRQRDAVRYCQSCVAKSMENTSASAEESDAAVVHKSPPVSSEPHQTQHEELNVQSRLAETSGLSTIPLSTRRVADSGTEGAKAQEHAPGASIADGLSGHRESPPQSKPTTTSETGARASEDPTSPSYYLYADDLPPNLEPTQAVDTTGSLAPTSSTGFQDWAASEPRAPFFDSDHVTGQLEFATVGHVLDQSESFWDMLVGPDDGGPELAYIFGQSEDVFAAPAVPTAKRGRPEEDEEDDGLTEKPGPDRKRQRVG